MDSLIEFVAITPNTIRIVINKHTSGILCRASDVSEYMFLPDPNTLWHEDYIEIVCMKMRELNSEK